MTIQKIYISGGYRSDVEELERNSLEPIRKEDYKRMNKLSFFSKKDTINGDAILIQIPEKRNATSFSGTSDAYFEKVIVGADLEVSDIITFFEIARITLDDKDTFKSIWEEMDISDEAVDDLKKKLKRFMEE